MDHGHIHPQFKQPLGRLESKQAPANNSSLLVLICCMQHVLAICDISETYNSLFICSWNWKYKRVGTGSYDEGVIWNLHTIVCLHDFLFRINMRYSCSGI
ncbi:hypothetical protein D3C72_1805530 [compost metagenome]